MILLEVNYKEASKKIEFPCRERYLQMVLEYLRVPDTQPPKLYVREVLSPRELSGLGGQVLNFDEIHYLSKRLESLSADEYDKLFAIVKAQGYTDPKEVINATFNLDCYTLARSKREMSSLGKKGIKTEYGLLFQTPGKEWTEVYDGQVFPRYGYQENYFLEAEIEYGGKKEYVYLPCEALSITKSLSRLNAPSWEVCSYALTDFKSKDRAWKNKFEELLERESIFDVNRLLENLRSCGWDLKKLSAVLEYAGAGSMPELIKLSERLYDFEFLPEVGNAEEVGRYLIEHNYDNEVIEELKEFIDYQGLGERQVSKNHGRFLRAGFVYLDSGATLEELLDGEAKEDTEPSWERTLTQ